MSYRCCKHVSGIFLTSSDVLWHRELTYCKVFSTIAQRQKFIYNTLPLSTANSFHTYSSRLQKAKPADSSKKGAIVETKDKPFSALTFGEKVQQAGKDATYTGVIIIGVAVTGIMFYAVGRELFSGQSSSGIYGRAFKLCRKNEELVQSFGEPLKAHGEMSSRGRRRFVRSTEFEVNGIKHMRMQFYIEGPYNKGTVHLESVQDERGKYQFRYIFVEPDAFGSRPIIIEDKR